MHAPSQPTNRTKYSVERQPRSKCDWYMLISRIEPDTPGHQLRTLESSQCGHEHEEVLRASTL
jgi:hypothetical protein